MLRLAESADVALRGATFQVILVPFAFTPLPGELAIERFKQEQGNWCYAACMKMIVRYHNAADPYEQCQFVGTLFPTLNCCGTPPICNQTCQSDQVVPLYKTYDYHAAHQAFLPSPGELVDEIVDDERPVEVATKNEVGDGEHAVVLNWAGKVVGVDQVKQIDPKVDEDVGLVLYEELDSRTLHCWTGIELVDDEDGDL